MYQINGLVVIRGYCLTCYLGVANNVITFGGVTDVAVIIAALLHDTVEDTATTLDEIEKEFGPEVRQIVAEVTDDKKLSRGLYVIYI